MAELNKLLDESTRPDNPKQAAPSIVGTVIGRGGKSIQGHPQGPVYPINANVRPNI